jgi:hypothetical protein
MGADGGAGISLFWRGGFAVERNPASLPEWVMRKSQVKLANQRRQKT